MEQSIKKSNAGRKKLKTKDKKVTINLFVPNSTIEELGGKEKIQSISYTAIEDSLKEHLKK